MKLGRHSPPAEWEGFFLIGLFPGGEWCKVQLFSGGPPTRVCLSAVEGMDGPGATMLILQGTRAGVAKHESRADELVRAADGWDVRAPGLRWEGTLEGMDLAIDEPRVHARVSCGPDPDILWWFRWRHRLAYWTAFGTLEWNGRKGVALVEQAWGAATRVNLARHAPRWHWDVLVFDDGSACAGLGSSLGPLRSGGRLPGEPFQQGRGLRVRRLADDRWSGTLHLGKRTFDYEARAATPLAQVVPGGGMMGFIFEGGTGFTEFGKPR
jgi:hypothetical protein